jgi:hypothetical protein
VGEGRSLLQEGHMFHCPVSSVTGLRQGDALSPLLFNFAVGYHIRKVQNDQKELKLIRTHQLLT